MSTLFFQKVYALTKRIPPGKVTTYGQIARALKTRDARRVGHALHANRDPSVPCHRVVNQAGRPALKSKLLKKEGVKFLDKTHVDLTKSLWPSPK